MTLFALRPVPLNRDHRKDMAVADSKLNSLHVEPHMLTLKWTGDVLTNQRQSIKLKMLTNGIAAAGTVDFLDVNLHAAGGYAESRRHPGGPPPILRTARDRLGTDGAGAGLDWGDICPA